MRERERERVRESRMEDSRRLIDEKKEERNRRIERERERESAGVGWSDVPE